MRKKRIKDSNFSVSEEPWLKKDNYKPDPSESSASKTGNSTTSEIDDIRNSVFNEPGFKKENPEQSEFRKWISVKREQCCYSRSVIITLLAALIGGPFAVIGAIMSGRQTVFAIIYIILFGPVTEELLKQSGMIYILERKPYHIFSKWQLVAGAVIGALFFAVIENLLYTNVYMINIPSENYKFLEAYRWKICTLLHVSCSLIASLGMIRIWQKQMKESKPADLSAGYPFFILAIAVHGTYNLIAILTHCMGYF